MYATITWKDLQDFIDTPQKKPNPISPDVEILLIGEYSVTGSNGNHYQTNFGVKADGRVFAACTCKGNLHRRACRHVKAAWPVHCQMADIDIEF